MLAVMTLVCRANDLERIALFSHFPELTSRIPWAPLGNWPTPIERLAHPGHVAGGDHIWIKREDQSSPAYGGNKVRTLEAHMGRALAEDADRIWGVGAFGSNHALATAVHAPRASLSAGIALFPQPPSTPARENLRSVLAQRPQIAPVTNVALLPFVLASIRRDNLRTAGERHYVMAPGGATPIGALGHVSAALELAEQVERGECPPFRHLVIAVGSTCTTAGLLVGLHIAAKLGIGFGKNGRQPPHVTAVRVTPWPITSPVRVALLAEGTARLLENLIGRVARIDYGTLRASLTLTRRYFGLGYGRPTRSGRRAQRTMELAGGPSLDVVYAAKSGAALFDLARRAGVGPIVFWSTKSSAPLPEATTEDIARAPRQMRQWLRQIS